MGASNSSKGKYHLIVDDSILGRKIMGDFLQFMNIKCDSASNGKQALSMIKTNNYDLVWMDLKMPVMNGDECVKRLREEGYDGKIVVVSGYMNDYIDMLKTSRLVNDVLTKPITFNQVKYYVKKHEKKQNYFGLTGI